MNAPASVSARLTYVGTGEALDPALANVSLLYQGSARILLDCGYGVPHAFWRVSRDPDLLDAIYLSHVHADHCFGLPALVLWMRLAGRRRPLSLLGGPGARDHLPRLLELGFEGAFDAHKCFPLAIDELPPGPPFPLGGLSLRTAPSAHSVPNHALRIDDAGIAIAYSGDGAPTPATTELFSSVRLLVHECYSVAPAVKGHACFEDVLGAAMDAQVTDLALVHLAADPLRRDPVRARATAQGRPPSVTVPRPGDEVILA